MKQRDGRQLGFWMCLALVVGNMIGSGIFLLPANLAPLRRQRDLGLGDHHRRRDVPGFGVRGAGQGDAGGRRAL